MLKQFITERNASFPEEKISASIDSKDTKADESADRMRLKERLRKSMSLEMAGHSTHEKRRIFWLDYIFGICAPDGEHHRRSAQLRGKRALDADLNVIALTSLGH